MKAYLKTWLARLGTWRLATGIVALGVLAMVGCYPGDITSVTDLDIVLTRFDSTHVWTDPSSFFVFDSVKQLKDTADSNNNLTIPKVYDSLILAETRNGLLALGFKETTSVAADYYVVVSTMAVQNWTVSVWYPYYPYYPCCYGGWGWYYPPVYDVDTYKSGTIFLDMYDQNKVDSANQLLARPWNAVLNGIMGSTAGVTQSRLQNGIRQAYVQSPYLKPQ